MTIPVSFTLNGTAVSAAISPSTTLADFVRGTGLTGTHLGCEQGVCGACTVIIDGVAARGCLTLAVQADGGEVTTIEALAGTGELSPAQDAVSRNCGLQCGFCTPGVLMTATAALAAGEDPTEALGGNLCRCTGYAGIRDAVAELTGSPVDAVVTGIRRLEDERLVTGQGRYVADLAVPGLLDLAFVRSTIAHGRITSVDLSGAEGYPGVVAVLTAGDLAAVMRPAHHNAPFPALAALEFGPLAEGVVRYVGDPIAAVLATDRATAEQAASLVRVSYDPLPVLTSAAAAAAPGAVQLFEEIDGNLAAFFPSVNPKVREELEAAPHRMSFTIENHRVAGSPIEPVGIVAVPNAGTGSLDVHSTTQSPYMVKLFLAELLGYDHSRLEVSVGDIGGGFGVKQHLLREELAAAAAAVLLGRPARWLQDRTEALVAGCHARDENVTVDAGFDDDGRLLAVDAVVTQDLGDPRLMVHGVDPALVTASFLPNAYVIPQYRFTLTSLVTNKAPTGAYRGYGQPEATTAIETLMSRIAEELGLDPVEVRHRNLAGDQRPFVTAAGARLDVGDMHALLDRMVASAPYAQWREQRDQARAEGRLVGIGHSMMVEGTAAAGLGYLGGSAAYDIVQVAVLADGSAHVQTATSAQGQGHETMLAAAFNAVTGIDPARVKVSHGSTSGLPFGFGATGSRTAVMTGGAVLAAAAKLVAKAEQIAAYLGRAEAAVLDPITGEFKAGDRTLSWGEIAFTAWVGNAALPPGMEPGLVVLHTHQAGNSDLMPQPDGTFNHCSTYSSAATGMLVEVFPDDGQVRILDALMVHDTGRVLHQPSVDGQLVGAFVQGAGMLLNEAIVYADDGQPMVSVLNDYRLPTITQEFKVRLEHANNASEVPGGMRGVGEAGIITGSSALFDAIGDAVSPLGVRPSSTRLSPGPLLDLLLAAPEPASG